MAKTSKTMLNSNGESGYPCLVPDFRGNAFNFSPLRIMFAEGFVSYSFYYVEVCSFYPCFLESFYHKWMLKIENPEITPCIYGHLMFDKGGKNMHPCLVPGLTGNAFSFSPLRIMFAVGLSYIAFIVLRYDPSIPASWRVFIINGC